MWPESSENSQPLRNGLTTGSCATACCVAAVRALLANKQPQTVEITLPRGEKVDLNIVDYQHIEDGIRTAIIKDAGDDPDATHGATIFVELRLTKQKGINFKAAQGVGTVTRDGLVLAIGEPAINPVPRKMITDHLNHYAFTYQYQGGFEVSVGVENGELIAKHTMNGRLGIIGGLSILGTTGIVRPYSCSAYIASIHQGIDVARANGITHISASTGIASERAIKDFYQMNEIAQIEMGDFVGAMLKYLRRPKDENQIKKLSISAGFGKLTKLANGHLDLNSRQSSIDFKQLAKIAKSLGASEQLQDEIVHANTSIEVLNKTQLAGLDIATIICIDALKVAKNIVHPSIEIEVWAVDRKGLFVANSRGDPVYTRGKEMKILVIGGTADGRHLATQLFELGFDTTYSIAGIVRKAKLPCPVVSGGFSQFGGLAQYVTDNQITHLVDVTHPFAIKMSNKIALVSKQLSIPSIRFHRLAWQKTARDHWTEVEHWSELIKKVEQHQSLFITAGQITQPVIDALASQSTRLLLRTAMPVKIDLPSNVTWIKAIGPFQLENEKSLIKQYQIDAIISKNSGGDSTYAKIEAAAELAIAVYQFKRPELQATTYQFDEMSQCVDLLQRMQKQMRESDEI